MKRLAYEAAIPWERFNDSYAMMGVARQMLGAIREQARAEGGNGECVISIMLAYEPIDAPQNIQIQ